MFISSKRAYELPKFVQNHDFSELVSVQQFMLSKLLISEGGPKPALAVHARRTVRSKQTHLAVAATSNVTSIVTVVFLVIFKFPRPRGLATLLGKRKAPSATTKAGCEQSPHLSRPRTVLGGSNVDSNFPRSATADAAPPLWLSSTAGSRRPFR